MSGDDEASPQSASTSFEATIPLSKFEIMSSVIVVRALAGVDVVVLSVLWRLI